MKDALILFQDENYVVANKPSGVSTHRGWDDSDDTLLTRVRDAVGMRVNPVHRLDRGASGVLLFALNKDATAHAAAALERASTQKVYVAITRGHLPADLSDGLLDYALANLENKRAPRVDAQTQFQMIEKIGRYALVQAQPLTGRLHQIRRHLKHLSCPIIGDVRYGKGEHNRLFRERFGLHRLALHACSLTIELGGQLRTFVAPLPEELTHALRLCREAFQPGGEKTPAPETPPES